MQPGLPFQNSSFTSVGDMFSKIGMVMMSEIGGAIGPLLGSFFMALAKPAMEFNETDLSVWTIMFKAGVDRVSLFGKAKPGEKTMLDALYPAAAAFQEAVNLDLPLGFSFRNAAQAARAGADETSGMVAKFGRAKFLGERSLGYQDPGANSIVIMLDAMVEALSGMDESGEINVRDSSDHLKIQSQFLAVNWHKNDAVLEIVSPKSDYALKQSLPFKLYSNSGKSFDLMDGNNWHLENDQLFLTCDNDALEKNIYIKISFPLSESCQIEILTAASNFARCSTKFLSSTSENFFGGGERFSSVNQTREAA